MTGNLDIFLLPFQFLAISNSNLCFNQVDSCNPFCDRMFYLDTSVHFHKVKAFIFFKEKFNRSCILISCCLCCKNSYLSHFLTKFLIYYGRWGFLNDFLMISLHRTVAFSQMNDITIIVGKNLKLYMAGILYKML